MKQTFQRSIGLESGVVVKKIDGQDCPFIADQSGGFIGVHARVKYSKMIAAYT